MTILLDGSSLTLEQVEAVARRGEHVILAPAARERVRAARATVEGLLAAERPVYGVTTGFGKLSDVRIPPEQAEALHPSAVPGLAVWQAPGEAGWAFVQLVAASVVASVAAQPAPALFATTPESAAAS